MILNRISLDLARTDLGGVGGRVECAGGVLCFGQDLAASLW